MSARFGNLTGITNSYGNTGLGVLGSIIRSTTATGEFGAGYLYNDLDPGGADDTKEIRGLVITPPTSGSLFAYEDGSFTLSGVVDGVYTFTTMLSVDGVDLGSYTVTSRIGNTVANLTVVGNTQLNTSSIVTLSQKHEIAVVGNTQLNTSSVVTLSQKHEITITGSISTSVSPGVSLNSLTTLLTVLGSTQRNISRILPILKYIPGKSILPPTRGNHYLRPYPTSVLNS